MKSIVVLLLLMTGFSAFPASATTVEYATVLLESGPFMLVEKTPVRDRTHGGFVIPDFLQAARYDYKTTVDLAIHRQQFTGFNAQEMEVLAITEQDWHNVFAPRMVPKPSSPSGIYVRTGRGVTLWGSRSHQTLEAHTPRWEDFNSILVNMLVYDRRADRLRFFVLESQAAVSQMLGQSSRDMFLAALSETPIIPWTAMREVLDQLRQEDLALIDLKYQPRAALEAADRRIRREQADCEARLR